MSMGGRSIQLARIIGIRVGVSPSWFFVLFLMIYSLSGYFDDVLSGSRDTAYAVAVGGAILFFASIVLHELGHAVVARRNGIGISGIDLWFFGGIAKMEREADTPGEEFRVAAAGPAVTLLIAGLSFAGAALLAKTHDFFDVATLSTVSASPTLALLGWLFLINSVLFAFNLIPAFPLDGGRIARAIAWRVTGDRNRATRVSGRVGQGFAYLITGYGIFLALAGSTINGIWFALMGMFLGQAARGAVVSSQVSERIEGVTVADLMDTDPFTLSAKTTALEAQASLTLHGVAFAPIVDEARRYLGYVLAERVDGAVEGGQPVLPVGELADEQDASLPPDAPLGTLLGTPALAGMGAVVVVEPGGRLAGVVTAARVRQAIAAVASQRPL
jgi:Zn-dependent protease/CBS domain-containing protein